MPDVRPTTLTLFADSDEAYDDMLAGIAAARERVWLETYIFSADDIGWRFAEALAARARAGVDVRLRVDSAGALESPYSKRIRRYLAEAGVDLRWFNRFWRALPSTLNHRDHRKLLVIDRDRVYVGSSNIVASNSRRLCGSGCTHQIDVRIEGAVAERMAAFGTALWEDGDRGERDWEPVAEGQSQLVAGSPTRHERSFRALYRALFEQARSTVYLASGFFIPDDDTIRLIERTARRGVELHLILPRISNMPPARWAAHALYSRLLAAGVYIHEYQPSILHVKAAVVDGTWATLGSANCDNRSFFLNYELSLESRDADFCRQLQQRLLADLERCEEITSGPWSRRPWQCRLRERLAWPVRRHL